MRGAWWWRTEKMTMIIFHKRILNSHSTWIRDTSYPKTTFPEFLEVVLIGCSQLQPLMTRSCFLGWIRIGLWFFVLIWFVFDILCMCVCVCGYVCFFSPSSSCCFVFKYFSSSKIWYSKLVRASCREGRNAHL